ncbi:MULTISPECIES: hypothetical protein [Nostocales]|uniref:Uncharacterized protein n=3 Tax=Nostocales TaxID=1161 RepID=A0A0C1NCG6_9CYAN|nr:hypothetical protein [Tolypothrix bouteillei]KAF3886413.1 hypothetical protein DA73_0400013700 [Tolypothrix bouteillei VB521301]
MAIDKIRIKKYQQSKVEEWSQALDIPVTKFIEDAINFYTRYLDGKQPVTIVEPVSQVSQNEQKLHPEVTVIDVEEPDDFDGGIEL